MNNGKPSGSEIVKEITTVIVGILALGGLAIFIIFLLGRLSLQEPEWTRAVYIFGAVEAIAFAAAGYFFGREVNRQRADNAEKRADEKEAQATDAIGAVRAEQQKGQAFAEAVRSNLLAGSGGAPAFPSLSGGGAAHTTTPPNLQAIMEMANRLYPSP